VKPLTCYLIIYTTLLWYRGKGKAVAVVVIPDEPAEILVPGSEAASAVSQVVCKAAANLTGRQLYEHIAACHSEVVSIQLYTCLAH